MLGQRATGPTGLSVRTRSNNRASIVSNRPTRTFQVRCSSETEPSTSDNLQPRASDIKIRSGSAWQSIIGPIGLFSATCVSGFSVVPTLGGGGSGGSGWFGGWGGGGGWGHGGSHAGQPLYDLAAADKSSSEYEEEEEQKDPSSNSGKWKDLITPTDEVDAAEGGRSGTNRCVEVVLEGWPSAGAVPSSVRYQAQDALTNVLGCDG